MAKIVRYNGNLVPFASSSLGTERTIFGQVTQANDITSQFTPQFLRGWGIVGPSDQPTLQDFNAVSYTHGQILAYLHQMGIAEYNATQEYHIGSLCQSGSSIWVSTANANVGNTPAIGSGSWRKANGGGLVATTVFDVSGTFTPNPRSSFAIFDVQGGGGQGGGSPAGTATQLGFGTGGHSGSRLVGRISMLGVTTLSITVGAGGTTGVAGAAGQTGGTSSVSTLITCPGGAGGGTVGPTAGPSIIANASAYPQPSATGAVTIIIAQPGNGGTAGQAITGGIGISGIGGMSPGYSGNVSGNIGTGTGSPGTQKGQGGSGAFSAINAAAQKGGDGGAGKVIVWEFE